MNMRRRWLRLFFFLGHNLGGALKDVSGPTSPVTPVTFLATSTNAAMASAWELRAIDEHYHLAGAGGCGGDPLHAEAHPHLSAHAQSWATGSGRSWQARAHQAAGICLVIARGISRLD